MLGFQEDEGRGLRLQVALLRLDHKELDLLAVPPGEGLRDQPGHVLVLQTVHAGPVHLQDQLAYFQPPDAVSRPVFLEFFPEYTTQTAWGQNKTRDSKIGLGLTGKLSKNQRQQCFKVLLSEILTLMLMILGSECLVLAPPSMAIPKIGLVFFTVILRFPSSSTVTLDPS